MLLSEAYNLFRDWAQAKYRPRTAQTYCYQVLKFINRVGDRPLEQVTLDDTVRYFLHLKRSNYENSSSALAMTALRQFFRLFFLQKRVSWDFQLIPVPRYSNKPFRSATINEMENLVEAVSVSNFKTLRDKTMLSFLCASGVRVSELVDLQLADLVKLDYAVITSRKNGQRRMVFWDERTGNLLDKYLPERNKRAKTDFLFISLDRRGAGGQLTTRTVQRIVQSYRGDMRISCHTLRHGLGMRAVRVNIHPRHIQTILGHKNLNSSQIYMDFFDRDILKSYRKIEKYTSKTLQKRAGEGTVLDV